MSQEDTHHVLTNVLQEKYWSRNCQLLRFDNIPKDHPINLWRLFERVQDLPWDLAH
jgi:hypothetical protein